MNKKAVVVVALGIVATVAAQEPIDHIDPVTVSPGMYRVMLENEHVRVVRYQIEPGQKDEWHTHPAKVSYVVSGGTLRVTLADGASFVVDEKSDSAAWLGAVGKHYVENIGTDDVHIVLVEIKSVDEIWVGERTER